MCKWLLLVLPVGCFAQDLPDAASFSRPPLTAITYAVPSDSSTRISDPVVLPRSNQERFHWASATGQTLMVLGVQHAANIAMDRWMRQTVKQPDFFGRWFNAVQHTRWTVWNDNDPFLDNYIAHPLIGSLYGWIQIQNDPKYRDLQLENSRRYWKSRLRAAAWSAVWSTQWEIGPVSEASIANIGGFTYYSKNSHGMTNGTGMADFVVTPVVGTIWLVGEDVLDRYLSKRLRRVSRKRVWLLGISILTPTRCAANLVRGKAPWYRDFEAHREAVAPTRSDTDQP
jgi:hypothetical protein